MKLDTGNCSFLALLGLAAGAYAALSAAACALISLLAYRVATNGFDAVSEAGWAMVPAVVFLVLVGLGGVLGAVSLARQVVASRRLISRLDTLSLPLPPAVAAAAQESRLRGRVRFVEEDAAFSFAYGALRPRVAVSSGLVAQVSEAELEAVLVHERYHVRNRDPLKVVLARALTRAFFYLPILGRLEARYVAGRELAADRQALRHCGRPSLAGALLKVVRGPSWPELSTAAAIGGPELLGVRIEQLETGTEPVVGRVTRGSLVASIAVAFLLLASFAIAVAGLGGLTAALSASEMDRGRLELGPLAGLGCLLVGGFGALVGWRLLRRRLTLP